MIISKDNYYEEDEKLFSTGNDELDDILEEVYYSGIEDGYDYAQREFAEHEKKVKLKTGDAINYYGNYGLIRKDGPAARLERDRISGNIDKNFKNSAIIGGITGAGVGYGLGRAGGASKKQALLYGAVGAAGTAAAAGLGAAAGTGVKRKGGAGHDPGRRKRESIHAAG